MSQPYDRVSADLAVALRNVRPVSVASQPDKDARRALIGAMGQHDFVTFAECRRSSLSARHIRLPRWFGIGCRRGAYNRNLGLLRTLAFSSLLLAASDSLATRAASLWGASRSSSRLASSVAASAAVARALTTATSLKEGPYEERIRSKRYFGSCHWARISS